MEGFVESGYLMTLVKGTEVLIGVLLVTNVLVPLALAALFPIGVNIIAFHLALGPATILPGLIVFALNLFLIGAYRSHFWPLLEVRGVPEVER
mgnify:CR=1 FL=1